MFLRDFIPAPAMRSCLPFVALLAAAAMVRSTYAGPALLKTHCAQCHSGAKPKGDFDLRNLGDQPAKDTVELWETCLDYVKAGEMPPAEKSQLSTAGRQRIVQFLQQKMKQYNQLNARSTRIPPRRLNNREFENSIRDVLMIEDTGTNLPTDNLIGDSLHHGFDTHGDTLGFSKFHLEQYIAAVRKIVDGVILSGPRPEPARYEISSREIIAAHTSQNTRRPERRGRADGFDFLDPARPAYFKSFKTAPETGWYTIAIRCTGKDRGRYDADATGIYDDDPIRLTVGMGDRQRSFDLPDEQPVTIRLKEWIVAGSRLKLHYPTDGLRQRGNGNFKFQNAIAGEYVKEHRPEIYEKVVADLKTRKTRRPRGPRAWQNWVDYWQGPRPRIYSAVIEGPSYGSWPPRRQVALLGKNPSAENAAAILTPIAERAWRRKVRKGELQRIVQLVQSHAAQLGDVEALKEGITAILTSPQFLLLNSTDLSQADRFASKMSYFLRSTIPGDELRQAAANGKLGSFADIRAEVQRQLDAGKLDPFLHAFPTGWLKLNDINFMAPDPDRYRFYHRKRISEDMVNEALAYFRYAVENNQPVPGLISADYSFINADLAKVYNVTGVAQDSRLRLHRFTSGRRGGLLGMGAFLTVTADSLGTSPIHRAVYVMENFLGIRPSPPPADVKIEEPDIRSARTIREVLEAHRSDQTCAACHQAIDPFGYAFENFDPVGAWRDNYEEQDAAGDKKSGAKRKKNAARKNKGGIPIDASATFRNGAGYQDIQGFRQLMQTKANRERFVRCFIIRLLTYANGQEPVDYTAISNIVDASARNGYRIVDTIAAVIHSPLFREE